MPAQGFAKIPDAQIASSVLIQIKIRLA